MGGSTVARRQRDYAAEYRARKAKAAQSGYASEREYKAARRIAKRTGAPVSREKLKARVADLDSALKAERAAKVKRERLLKANRLYGQTKAVSPTAGKGDDSFAGMSDAKLQAFYDAFPHPTHGYDASRRTGDRSWLEAYLVGFAGWTQEQFERAYGAKQ